MKKILISTGGSGGHVIPATIFYEHLHKEFQVVISTDIRGSRFLSKNKYDLVNINTPKLNNLFFLPINIFIVLYLTIKSYFFLKRKNIEKLISTGGYMSLPVILAAKLLQLDIYLFEPNLVIGRANKLFLGSCKKIFCYSEKILNFPIKFKNKIIILDPLVRKEFYNSNMSPTKKSLFQILVVGGSQGARIFDNDIKNSFLNISKKYPLKIIHQTSEKNVENLKNFYALKNIENFVFSFDKNFMKIVQGTDFCITRAGASTLAELSILNIPFLAIPLPSSKDNHQLENAKFYKDINCCWVLDQKFFNTQIEDVLEAILVNRVDYLQKKDNLKKLNNKNSWLNVNQKIIRAINEN